MDFWTALKLNNKKKQKMLKNKIKKLQLKNFLKFSPVVLSPLALFSCNQKDSSQWGDTKFQKIYTKLSYKEDDQGATFVAPFSNNDSKQKSSVIYQLLVYAFADGNNDGIGDFIGLKNNLDYFVNLGIDQLYLSPIHPASSYHGYDVIDYTDVAAELGGKEAFIDFLKEAHKKGIKVYLDMVFNHTSYEHPWFQKALEGDAKYKNFYHFYDKEKQDTHQDDQNLRNIFLNIDQNKGATNQYYTSKFWAGMPDLNLDNPEVIEELKHIQSYWTKLGVDGFRYDAIVEFFSSYGETKNNYNESKILYELRQASLDALKSTNREQDLFTMGEWWEATPNARSWFSYNNEQALKTVYDGAHWKLKPSVSQSFSETIDYLKSLNIDNREIPWVPFLTNHDVTRWINIFRSGVYIDDLQLTAEELKKDPLRKEDKLAVANAHFFLLSMPATPIIYHGDELYLHGVKAGGDAAMREPFNWQNKNNVVDFYEKRSRDHISLNISKDTNYVEKEISNPNSTYSIIKQINNFRKQHPFMFSQNINTIEDPSLYLEQEQENAVIRTSEDKKEKYLFISSSGVSHQRTIKLKDGVDYEIIYSFRSKPKNSHEIDVEPYGMFIAKIAQKTK
ncbi:alpha-amylase family glycosyl hydrolase [Mycoplasma procyoni]|uniref:alpha-amylase family glycosyl hydrolase n=1 Tax=Mycoplasma procyoni TaxID=568784 RepID=UPI00197B07DC|nr:alpha-amylase family glycosyl hydrolase [Mycoplasma procyoni]MBN3534893.1 alpha-amylase [Mycoplasma procyoni]